MKDKKTLLLVDDDIAHRTMLRILLDWQYEIFEVDNGSTAVEEANKRDFDLILMDIRMPGISGIEALEQITSLRPDVPILIMTAYFSNEIADQAKDKGAFGCLGKPFDFEELKLTMERAILSWRPRQSAVL
ncbi:response regulator [Thermodesulfobacteriota bacterium]